MKKLLLIFAAALYLLQPAQAADVFFSVDEKAHNIIAQGTPEQVKELLSSGYDVNKVYNCSTLLQKTIQSLMKTTSDNNDSAATLKKIEILIAAGADVNKIACPQTGVSPLIWTMALPLHGVTVKNNVNTLLDKNLLTKDSGLCDFAPALKKTCQDLQTADIKKIYDGLRSSFDEYPQILTQDALKISTLLLNAGANINQKDATGRTVMHLAAMLPPQEGAPIMQFLIQRGADVNARDIYGQSPLFFAFNIDNTTAVALLQQAGANLSFKNRRGALYNQKNGIIINGKKTAK